MLNSWLLFGHLISVAVLIVGVGLEHNVLAAGGRATTVAELRVAVRPAKFLGAMFPISALALTAFGMSLVAHDSDEFSFSDAWVVAAICIVATMFVIGPLTGKRAEKLAKAADEAEDGPLTPELSALALDGFLHAGARISGVAVLWAIWLMSIKPSAAGVFVTLGIALVLCVGASFSALARSRKLLAARIGGVAVTAQAEARVGESGI